MMFELGSKVGAALRALRFERSPDVPPVSGGAHGRDARVAPGRSALILAGLLAALAASCRAETVAIELPAHPSPRVAFGAGRLSKELESLGESCRVVSLASGSAADRRILVGVFGDPAVRSLLDAKAASPGPEGFALSTAPDGALVVAGGDDSGALYGCLELARRAGDARALPQEIADAESPALRFRGACVGLQKPALLPGSDGDPSPLTPELFPWFYDKDQWLGFLDFLADNRMNVLCLWSGHPFASLVKVKDYPYALEVSGETCARNADLYRFLIREADRRGIRLVQGFCATELSKPFAERNGLSTRLQSTNPAAADYLRKSLAEFVRQYPQVRLMVTLGEALRGCDSQLRWFTEVVAPCVRDGLGGADAADPPPIILRTHSLGDQAPAFLEAALKVCPRIETEQEFNGEALTTDEPRGDLRQLHLAVGRPAGARLVGVGPAANLEPFRYGDRRFIQRCVQAMRDRLGAGGLQLYPLSACGWPYAPDRTSEPLLQYQRDWIWYEAWGRYAWNPAIPASADDRYWTGRLAAIYGAAAAEKILAAYDDAGECAPRLLRRFGITEGDRQTLSLGMTLDQLVDPAAYRARPELRPSPAPAGERLQEYVDREWNHEPHSGETPPRVIRDVLGFSERAVDEIDEAGPLVTDNGEEFGRLQNDIHCIREMTLFYAAKAQAAMLVLRYAHSHRAADLRNAAVLLRDSLEHYRALAQLTAETYRCANSLQTARRDIPFAGFEGGEPANFHWTQVLPAFEKEYRDFQARVGALPAR